VRKRRTLRKRCPALFDSGHDHREVVVEENEVGGFSRDVGAGFTHGDADVRFVQRRAVVDAVAGHRHDVTPSAQRFSNAQLVLRGYPGDDDPVPVEYGAENLLIVGQVMADEDRIVYMT
jgi:hypothetical protein